MSLRRVTITGADDGVAPRELLELSEQYPFVEWGILVSPSREGTPRYPTALWRYELLQEARDVRVQLAMHLCGQASRDTLAGDPKWFIGLSSRWGRLQLNGFEDTAELRRDVGLWTEWILQCRTEAHLDAARDLAERYPARRISALWDLSGGRGIEIDSFPMRPALRIGFAGGITPSNVTDVIARVGRAVAGGPFSARVPGPWIDMESGVRSDDRFDLEKVRDVLRQVAPFVEKEAA